MFDLFFVMMAAGMSAAPDNGAGGASAALVAPPAVTAPAPSVDSAQIAPLVAAPQPEPLAVAPQAQAPVAAAPQTAPLAVTPQVQAPAAAAQLPVIAPTPPAPNATFNMAVVPQGLTPYPQVPSGKFTTAAEVKPILTATKANWVVLREYEGRDWLYVTHLWSWRCGLKAMAISLNNEPMQNWPMPGCYETTTTPNTILPDDGVPVLTLRLGSVQTIKIQIVYDDLSMDVAEFARGSVLIP